MNNILTNCENSSDDFFQSKHIEKRRQQSIVERIKIIHELQDGIDKIRTAYENKDWKDEKEKLFLEIFSSLHFDDKFHPEEGYYLINVNNDAMCRYDSSNNIFCVNSHLICKVFDDLFDIKRWNTLLLLEVMIKEYFELHITYVSRLITQFPFY